MDSHISYSCDYEAEFAEESFGEDAILLQGAEPNDEYEYRLVGLRPKLRFWKDRLIIFASEEHGATVRHASFPVGDAVRLTARPRDRLYVQWGGGFGLSVLRGQRLVFALGVVTRVPLGADVQVVHGSKGDRRSPSRDTWLEFAAGGESLRLRGREFAEAGGYYIYVERCWEFGIPGTSECAAVCAGDDPAVRLAAARSAVLLGHGALKLVEWDNTERFGLLYGS